MFARLFRNPVKIDRAIDLGSGNHVQSIEDYDVIRGIELIGGPTPISYEEMARHPRNKKLPKLKKLLNPRFYQKHFYSKIVKLAADSLGEKKGLVERVVSSPVDISSTERNVFIFPAEFVNYRQAVQFLRRSESGELSVNGDKPNKYSSGRFLFEKCEDELEGLVGVEVFSQPVDFRKYFATPKELYDWQQNQDSIEVIQDVFDSLRKNVEEKAKEIEKAKKVNVKGILLSDIKPEVNLTDNLFTINTNCYGDLVLG